MSGAPYRIVLAAGGTGGHVIPALAVAEELAALGHLLRLVTDRRGSRYADVGPEIATDIISAGRLAGGRIIGALKALPAIVAGTVASIRILRRFSAHVVVGFGGYPALPVLLAAVLTRTPACLHEQNAHLGRVNRLMLWTVRALAVSYRTTVGVPRRMRALKVVTGNPIRAEVADLYDNPYSPPEADGEFRIVVLGGSQGAAVMDDVVPAAISVLPRSLRRRIHIVQQCRDRNLDAVKAKYRDMEVRAELATFLDDVASQLRQAHMVIARAGASTLCEIAVAGRPAVLVPLPGAMDDHQTANARVLEKAGGARLMPQSRFKPPALAKLLQRWARRPAELQQLATGVRCVARPEAARSLADLVEWLGRVSLRRQRGLDADAPVERREPHLESPSGSGRRKVAS